MGIQYDPATMSTGMADIDAQHQELIRMLNDFLDAMRAGKAQDKLKDLLGFLGAYATKHFAHEEGCMNRFNCPMAAANKNAHANFLTTFKDIAGRVEKEGPKATLIIEAETKLAEWVKNHIVKVDTSLRGCVKK